MLAQEAIYSNLAIKKVMVDCGNRFLSMTVSRLKVFALYRMLMISLRRGCKSFHVKDSKLELKHEEFQGAYYRGNFVAYMQKREKDIRDYSLRDVAALIELFFKVKDVVADISSLNLEDELTTASMTYKAFLKSLDEETRKNIPIVDLKMNKIIRQAMIGGRTGYYWECSSYDIFKPYMGSLMEKKMEQDVLKESGSEEYNPALREMLRLWMNALSGKAIQRVFTEEKRFCMNDEDMARCLNNLNVNATSSVGNITMVSGELNHPIVKVPSIWSVLTYSYARSYEMPEIFGDTPGQMKEELGKNKYGVFKAKEFHIVYSYGDDGKVILLDHPTGQDQKMIFDQQCYYRLTEA
ncbi:hypothetical protein BGZ89_003526 [Linnemannia elongata]|nr:hypothetical protein BGZ89_003526 [Linnemannia elongata]